MGLNPSFTYFLPISEEGPRVPPREPKGLYTHTLYPYLEVVEYENRENHGR